MGLDLYFIKSVAKPHVSRRKKHKEPKAYVRIRYEIGSFRGCIALFEWINTHVEPVDNCRDMFLDQEHLEALLLTLEKITMENCHDLFPGDSFLSYEYGEDYWKDVNDLRFFVKKTLKNLNESKNESIIFRAWY